MSPFHRQWFRVSIGAFLLCTCGLSLAENRFQLPLGWSDRDGRYAVTARIDLPGESIESLEHLVGKARGWCRVARLVPDVRDCRASEDPGSLVLELRSNSGDGGREVHHRFDHRRTAEGLEAQLIAPAAPLGVTDAGLSLEARQSDGMLRMALTYGYRSSLRSRMVTGAYLRSAAGRRPGISRDPETDELVTDLRGLMERNAMRYFLALVASLEHADERTAAEAWIDSDATFEADLAEQERDAYLGSRVTSDDI